VPAGGDDSAETAVLVADAPPAEAEAGTGRAAARSRAPKADGASRPIRPRKTTRRAPAPEDTAAEPEDG
jgi:hypothetical protein